MEDETGEKPRGILVYDGARKLSGDVQNALHKVKNYKIDVMHYELSVMFSDGW